MSNILIASCIFICTEIIALPIFYALRKYYSTDSTPNPIIPSILKGILERAFLYIGIMNSVPTVLIMFGALKVATRLDASKNKISNDYFLVGNIVSAILVIIASSVCKLFLQ